jgi:hypothetical protein
VEATYGLRGLSPELRSVTLKTAGPARRLKGGQLSVGSLDPLIEEFRKRPPPPNASQPRVRIEDGSCCWPPTTARSALGQRPRARTASSVAGRRRTAPAQLKGPDFTASLAGRVFLDHARPARTSCASTSAGHRVSAGGASLTGGRFTCRQRPYPDLSGSAATAARSPPGGPPVASRRDQRPGAARRRSLRRLHRPGQRLDHDPRHDRASAANLRSRSGASRRADAWASSASLVSDDLRWTRKGGDRLRRIAAGRRRRRSAYDAAA